MATLLAMLIGTGLGTFVTIPHHWLSFFGGSNSTPDVLHLRMDDTLQQVPTR
jgi:hypothetical protein